MSILHTIARIGSGQLLLNKPGATESIGRRNLQVSKACLGTIMRRLAAGFDR